MDQMFFVLEMKEHGLAKHYDQTFGGINHRYLNVTGRWSTLSTVAVPLIAWTDHEEATSAAETASTARRRLIKVSNLSQVAHRPFKIFSQPLRAALLGYLPYGETKKRKLELRRLKLMHYAKAVLAVYHAADQAGAETASRTATSDLRKLYGGGSVISAMQYLAGKDAADVLARVLDGELVCDEGQTPERLVQAVSIAVSEFGPSI